MLLSPLEERLAPILPPTPYGKTLDQWVKTVTHFQKTNISNLYFMIKDIYYHYIIERISIKFIIFNFKY